MKNKSHDRSPDKRGFSVALPINLIDEIERIAKSETRSRNNQIERFLSECVKEYHKSKHQNPTLTTHRLEQRSA